MQYKSTFNKLIPTLLIVLPLLAVVSVSAANGGIYAPFANAGYGGSGYGGQLHEFKQSFAAQIDGPQEVPPTTSHATGTALINVGMDEREVDYSVQLQNESNITDVALYCARAGSNGPKVVSLFHSATPVNTQSFTGTITESDLLAAAVACNPNIHTASHFVQAMREGGIYINVLTTLFPAGEIRGQLHDTPTTHGGGNGNGNGGAGGGNGGGGNGNGGNHGEETLTPSSATVHSDQHIDFNGRNFPHETDIIITRDGTLVGHAHADGGGNYTTGSMTMPTAPGTYVFTFTPVSGGTPMTSTITVQNFI